MEKLRWCALNVDAIRVRIACSLTSKRLRKLLGARKARALELEYIRSHGVYRKVDMQQCRERTEKERIAVRWVELIRDIWCILRSGPDG